MVAGGALIPRAPALVVALLINAVSVVAILAFAGSMAPAMAQESTDECRPPQLSVAVGTATLCRFRSPVGTVIPGDSSIADTSLASDRIVVVHAKKVGVTNVIVLDPEGRAMLNTAVVVGNSPYKGQLITLHVPTPRFPVQKFYTYGCRPGKLCDIVSEPQPVVDRSFQQAVQQTIDQTNRQEPGESTSTPPQQ